MYRVTCKIEFCYGHRLLHYKGKCRHLHGHNGMIEVVLCEESLDAQGMVRDFVEVKKIIQDWINETLDHKMILWRIDPLIPSLKASQETFYEVDENPTAEVISKLIYDYVLSQGLPVVEVSLWESARSCATYRSKDP